MSRMRVPFNRPYMSGRELELYPRGTFAWLVIWPTMGHSQGVVT